jgi:hypothetical protein
MSSKKQSGLDLLRWVVLLFVLITACTASPVETNVAPSVAPSTTPANTFTPSPTPTEVSTLTPVPSITPTPQPEWVTNFAQPILDAIANRPPDFEDGFDKRSIAWKLAGWCGDWRMRFEEEEMILTQCNAYVDHAYTDFVVEVDTHFTPADKAEDGPFLGIIFRMEGDNGGYEYQVHYGGYVSCGRTGGRTIFASQQSANPGTQTNHLLVIAKGPEITLFLNGEPLAHFSDSSSARGNVGVFVKSNSSFWKAEGAFDNYRIWDISDLP